MHLRGYMIDVTLTDDALTVEATNKAAAAALRGQQRGDGPLVLPLTEIASVEHKKASALTNGRVTVRTSGGERYDLHFRKKSADAFADLAAALA